MHLMLSWRAMLLLALTSWPGLLLASGGGHDAVADAASYITHPLAFLCLGIFAVGYALVIAEEGLHLRKSKPMLVAAGAIWVLVAIVFQQHGDERARGILEHNLLEYAQLFLFLLAAMTYINTMGERNVFNALRAWLVSRGFSLKTIYWVTGALAFWISPVADNLTTALLMSTVLMAVGGNNRNFVVIGCINVVVAANAGGAFSPFGDITTLMVWQRGIIEFQNFFVLLIPALVNWGVPAAIMSFGVPNEKPEPLREEQPLLCGAYVVITLFLITIAMAVSMHTFLHLPPVLGMMTGLGFLKLFGWYLKVTGQAFAEERQDTVCNTALGKEHEGHETKQYDVFQAMQHAEWDTLIFFYGVILAVGGLGALGYLSLTSEWMYGGLGHTYANILVGVLSAIVDNIPVMFAVLTMHPDMSQGQWLLVTLTAGVGGSLLSIGSAAGVAVMGQARGVYTFFAHLKWTWAIAIGYAASIWVHFLVNGATFAK